MHKHNKCNVINMKKVFYKKVRTKTDPFGKWEDSEEYEIMGMSDDENAMEFPCVEVDKDYHSSENLTVVKEKNSKGKHEMKVVITKGVLYETAEETDTMKKKKEERWAKIDKKREDRPGDYNTEKVQKAHKEKKKKEKAEKKANKNK